MKCFTGGGLRLGKAPRVSSRTRLGWRLRGPDAQGFAAGGRRPERRLHSGVKKVEEYFEDPGRPSGDDRMPLTARGSETADRLLRRVPHTRRGAEARRARATIEGGVSSRSGWNVDAAKQTRAAEPSVADDYLAELEHWLERAGED